MSVRFCRECGTRITDTDKFCFNCGTPVSPAPQPPAPAVAEPIPAVPVFVPEISVADTPVVPENPSVPDAPAMPEVPQVPEIPAEPVYSAAAEPTYVPVQEPSYGPVAEPIFSPVQNPSYAPVTEPSFRPMQEPSYGPVTEPSFQPVQEPSYGPVTEPSFQPVQEPAYGPVINPAYAPSSQPAPEPPAKPAKQPKTPKPAKPVKPLPKRTFLNVFSCVLICILLAVLILPTVLLVDVRMMANEERILGVLENVDLDAIPAKNIFIDVDDDRTMLDWACQFMNKNFRKTFQSANYHWSEIQPKTLSAFFEDTNILDMTADTVAGVMNDVIHGTAKTSLDASDIETFLKENSEFLAEEMNLVLDQNSRANMADQAMSLLKTDEFSLDALRETPVVEIATAVLSLVTLILLGVLVVLLIVLLFVANRKYIMAGIHDTGLVMLIVGILLLALTGAARLMLIFGAEKNGIIYLIGVLAGALLESGLLVSSCIFAFGILLLLISGITLSVLKKKAAKA